MPIPLVDLQAQMKAIRPEVDAAVAGVLERGDFILGRAVEEFERAFATFVGTRHCVGVASGTDALWLSLKALGVGPGDKVLVPANTFIATALAVSLAGATPVLVDVDPESFTIDVEKARRALEPGTKAIIPVHLYGQPADMQRVMDLAREKGLILLEDAAQAHGAAHTDGGCGTFGQAAGFSFYPGKNLGAYGDGGAVCTDGDAVANRLRELRNWGSTVKYHHPVQGFNSRLDTLQAAILKVKLGHLAGWNERRAQIAEWYRIALAPLEGKLVLPRVMGWTARHVYHLFVIRLVQADRDAVLARLHAAGVGAGIHYPVPVHLQGAYASLGLGVGAMPVTEGLAKQILSLPIYPEMGRADVEFVAAALSDAIRA
jgi:dTDP-4-amino-4,6-dideoxygalactose transaminase